MAKVFKTFINDDITTTRTLLHEAVPVTGGIVNGTSYDENDSAVTNIKNYSHEMFQSVYDYTYTKSSANHIFDMSIGVNASSDLYDPNGLSAEKKKIIYNEFAQILAGHNVDGSIRSFDSDGDYSSTTDDKYNEAYIISIARLLNKDEIKKGSFYIKLNVQRDAYVTDTNGARQELLISDEGAESDYKVNSPAGDYGILKCRTYKHYEGTWTNGVFAPSSTNEVYTLDYDPNDNTTGYNAEALADAAAGVIKDIDPVVGLIFYQAGVVILSPNVFVKYEAGASDSTTEDSTSPDGKLPVGLIYNAGGGVGLDSNNNSISAQVPEMIATDGVEKGFKENTIPENCAAFRKRIHQIAFNNTTELNSTIYFCRINHNDFNYSSNPPYLDAGKIRVKQVLSDAPVSYITSVGLYSASNELLAVDKLSEPLRKDPTNEMVLRVRLDY